MELPRALSPWAEELSLFAPDLALGLGDLVRKLALFVGPMRTDRTIALADGSGLDGIDSRGSYERLLLSEWLLADEIPDEFTRRAASGEHMFLRPARRGPSHARASIALFDAGPSQLGSPRVAHIALLIVLARRAAAANATFRWGILQSQALRDDVTRGSLSSLVGAGTTQTVDRERLKASLASYSPSDDVWIIGGDEARTTEASTVLVRDVLALDRRCVSLELHVPHAPVRRATLDLPSERDTARLLRDPFGIAKAAPTMALGLDVPQPTLVFADNGSKVFARTSLGVLSIPVPNSPRAGVGKPKLQRAMEVVAAVGRGPRRPTLLVAQSHGHLALTGGIQRGLGPFAGNKDEHAPFRPSEDDPLRPLLVHGDAIGFVDSLGRLFEMRPNGSTRLVGRNVKAANPRASDGYVFVGLKAESESDAFDDAFRPLQLCKVTGSEVASEPLSSPDVVGEVFLTTDRAHAPLVVLGVPGGAYGISADGEYEEWTPPDRVLGVHRQDTELALLTMDSTRREVSSVTRSTSSRLLRTAGAIVSATLDPAGHTFALLTEDGSVVLYSVARREHLHTFEFRSAP